MLKNIIGRELPEKIGDYLVKPFMGAYISQPEPITVVSKRTVTHIAADTDKVVDNLEEAIRRVGLTDGMTISFHHGFREGDMVVSQVLAAIRKLGIKNLRFAPSAVVNIKNPSLDEFVYDGTITRVEASGIRGALGDAALAGKIEQPVILRPHGARPRAIEAGELQIDVAFIGASAADEWGNATGQIGPNACGALGYAMIDATSAHKVVVVTDNLVEFPCHPASISQQFVDCVAVVEKIGDPEKIGVGAARMTKNPRDLLIASRAADVIAASNLFQEGLSFQTGAGAISIACTNFLSERMEEKGIKASFALGGMTASIVEMFYKGQVRLLLGSQSFDAVAARAIADHPNIVEIDNALYSHPHRRGCLADKLDFGVLGALEVDTDFNVNLLTGSSGEMMGGLGGGPDVAAGAAVSVVTLPVVRGRTPSIVKRVFTACTPGETVAVVVTEAGIALNPKHRHYDLLKQDLEKTNLKLVDIHDLQKIAESMTGVPKPIACEGRVACIVEYRDGSVIDVIHQLKK